MVENTSPPRGKLKLSLPFNADHGVNRTRTYDSDIDKLMSSHSSCTHCLPLSSFPYPEKDQLEKDRGGISSRRMLARPPNNKPTAKPKKTSPKETHRHAHNHPRRQSVSPSPVMILSIKHIPEHPRVTPSKPGIQPSQPGLFLARLAPSIYPSQDTNRIRSLRLP